MLPSMDLVHELGVYESDGWMDAVACTCTSQGHTVLYDSYEFCQFSCCHGRRVAGRQESNEVSREKLLFLFLKKEREKTSNHQKDYSGAELLYMRE